MRAAAHLFYERGYEATSVQDVAVAAGLLKGSLYYYIRTKEDLLYAVVEQAHGSMMALVNEVKQLPEEPVLPRLERFLRRHMELLLRDRDMYGVVLQDYSSLSGRRRKEATATRNEYAQFLQELIEQGQREGIVSADLNPRLTCLGVLGMMNWTYKWYRPSDPLGKTEIVDGLVVLALRALGVRISSPLAEPLGASTGCGRSNGISPSLLTSISTTSSAARGFGDAGGEPERAAQGRRAEVRHLETGRHVRHRPGPGDPAALVSGEVNRGSAVTVDQRSRNPAVEVTGSVVVLRAGQEARLNGPADCVAAQAKSDAVAGTASEARQTWIKPLLNRVPDQLMIIRVRCSPYCHPSAVAAGRIHSCPPPLALVTLATIRSASRR